MQTPIQSTLTTSYAVRYRVLSDKLELRQGSEFTVEDVPVKHGDLALFAFGDGEDNYLLPGRYHSTVGDMGGHRHPRLPDPDHGQTAGPDRRQSQTARSHRGVGG